MYPNPFPTSSDVECICPKCGSTDVRERHYYGSYYAPECNYKYCELCEHQWDHT